MTYKELKEMFRKHNKESKVPIVGYIVFTEDSFDKPYTREERTYLVSSNNKAYLEGMAGYSVFGDCLDGKDLNVRLDWVMKSERGGRNGWVVEDCYLA